MGDVSGVHSKLSSLQGWSIGPDMATNGGSERRIGADDEQIRGITGIVRPMQDKYRTLACSLLVRILLCQHIISQRKINLFFFLRPPRPLDSVCLHFSSGPYQTYLSIILS
jgi:hypothetical protein